MKGAIITKKQISAGFILEVDWLFFLVYFCSHVLLVGVRDSTALGIFTLAQ